MKYSSEQIFRIQKRRQKELQLHHIMEMSLNGKFTQRLTAALKTARRIVRW